MKKTIAIIIIVFLILLGGIGYYLYLNNGNQSISSGKIFNNVKNFFPFGDPSTQTEPVTQNDTNTPTQNTNIQPIKIDRMFQISNVPTAGYISIDTISTSSEIFFNKEKNATTSTTTKQTETFVRFVERATGHILETKISNLEKNRILNTTIPKIYESYLNSKGSEFITRTLSGENIVTEYRKIEFGTSTTIGNIVSTINYPSNTDIFITKGDTVFYTTKTSFGSVGYLSNFDNKKPIQIFSTPLREIGASWSGGNIIEIFSKPNSQYDGISFVVDIKNKTIKESLSGILGLTTNISTDGAYSLYNTNIEKLTLGAKVKNTNTAIYLTTSTLPEKCVWSKKNTKIIYCAVPRYFTKIGYPEKWYQGQISFNDDFWSINIETGEQNLIYRPTADEKQSPDAINLNLNDKENYLFFIDKKDLTLWGLSI
jgi:hypothetical protein